MKKCNHCEKYLPIDEFEIYSGERGKTNLRSSRASYCKECRSGLRLINLLKKKYYIIETIFNRKCSECDRGLEYLPCFEFHHPIPNLKTTTWTHIKHYSINKIINWIKREKVILLCSNCHEMKKDKYFINFQKLVMNDALLEYSAEDIDEMINYTINTHLNYSYFKDYKRNIKIQIKKYIRKRFVFNQLFSGRCVGCGKATIFDYLPTLELHHLNPVNIRSKSNWRDIANQDCKSIINQIIKENSICLCSNCHILIGSKLNDHLEHVIEDKHTRSLFLKNYKILIRKYCCFDYNLIHFDLKSPLKLKFSQDEFWKIRIMQISIFLKNNNIYNFKVTNLHNLLNQNKRTIRYYLDKLTSLFYIHKTQESTFPFDNCYMLTDLGRNIVEELKVAYQKTYSRLENEITSMEDYMNRQNRWIN
jgi:hypothetical protein